MTRSQLQQIYRLSRDLRLPPDMVIRNFSLEIESGIIDPDVNSAIEAVRWLERRFLDKIGADQLWNWFVTSLPAFDGRSLLWISLAEGIEPVQAYAERLSYGDFS